MGVGLEDSEEVGGRGVVAEDAVDAAKFDEGAELFFIFFELSTRYFGAVDEERVGDLECVLFWRGCCERCQVSGARGELWSSEPCAG